MGRAAVAECKKKMPDAYVLHKRKACIGQDGALRHTNIALTKHKNTKTHYHSKGMKRLRNVCTSSMKINKQQED